MAFPNGVLIATDGTYTDLAVTESDRHPILIKALGGLPECAYYGTAASAICVIVHETGVLDGLPINQLAILFVETVRGGLLSYALHGPVVLLDYHPQADQLMNLSDDHRQLLAELAGRDEETA